MQSPASAGPDRPTSRNNERNPIKNSFENTVLFMRPSFCEWLVVYIKGSFEVVHYFLVNMTLK
jgi:hypothetical protein